MEITLLGAFGAGILSFLSPCVLPLVPPYLSYITGISHDELVRSERQTGRRFQVILAAFAFVTGFSAVFMAFGATASALGQTITEYAQVLTWIAGGVIILFGLHFLGVLRIGFLYRQMRLEPETRRWGLAGALLVGAAFAFGWTPCVGPFLAAILALAGGTETLGEGTGLLAAYAGGIGVPFILSAVFVERFLAFSGTFRRHLGLVEKISGVLLILTGILFISGGMADIAFWLLEYVPTLGELAK